MFEVLFAVLMFLGVCFVIKGFELRKERREKQESEAAARRP